MAFEIKNIVGAELYTVESFLVSTLLGSRFDACVKRHENKITIHKVRLRKKKDYCGNHPYACPVRPGPHKPHKEYTYLEGADWVGFNDMLNHALDILEVSANVASSQCIIRKGYLSRTEYKGHKLSNGIDSEWDKDTEDKFYVNCF